MLLSICIPTFNRKKYLENCLNSIKVAIHNLPNRDEIEICVSDNGSSDGTSDMVERFTSPIELKFIQNKSNIGFAKNMLQVVNMASGEYVWVIGSDDLLLPNSIIELVKIIKSNKNVDYFYVNAFHLNSDFIFSGVKPFDIHGLPRDMRPFSSYGPSRTLPFLKLINPKFSFDFLGGIFLSVFRRTNWLKNTHHLNTRDINDARLFSSFDNTFPHMKVLAHAFSMSTAYYSAAPMIICLSGAREWTAMGSLIMSFRLVESLAIYRKCGLPLIQYIACKNYALRKFVPDFLKMIIYYKISGIKYITIMNFPYSNLLYPNFYFSIFIHLIDKIKLKFHAT
jgi:glycosyltransferase involved in cell wall biosynthesis